VEATAQISVTYNPSFGGVGVNFVHLTSGGKVIRLTRNTRFRVLEREAASFIVSLAALSK